MVPPEGYHCARKHQGLLLGEDSLHHVIGALGQLLWVLVHRVIVELVDGGPHLGIFKACLVRA